MFKHLVAATTATFIALAIAPANATHKGVPHGQSDSGDSQTLEAILNLLEPKTIFVSSMSYTGDLGGLAGADIICQGLADAPGSIIPDGEYVALLSDNIVDAAARLTASSGPYIRPDGVPVAANFAALFATILLSPDRVLINQPLIDEAGMVQDIDPEVFTGSLSSGIVLLDKNCVGWTNGTDAEAAVGFSNRVDGGWLNNGTGFCDNPGHLYCVQR